MSVFSRVAALLLSAALAGCALLEPVGSNEAGRIANEALKDRDSDSAWAKLIEDNQKLRAEQTDEVTQAPAREGSGIVGEVSVDKTLARKGKPAPAKGEARPVKLDFVDASLNEVVVAFMDYLKQPYSFQDSFKDRKVNLFFDGQATREDLIMLFAALLDSYGVKLRYSAGVYYVGSADDKAAPLQQPSPLGIGDSLGVFRLSFIDAREFQNLAKQVTRYPEKIIALPGNILVVNSTGTDVRAVRSLVEDVDIPAFAGKYVLIYVPRYLSAASLVGLLDSAMGQLSGAGQGGTKQFEAKQVPESERIVIVAANKTARDLVVQILDQSDVAGGNYRRVFQYVLGTQSPAEILPNVNLLVKSVVKSPAEINIVPDKVSNSLFIYASPEEYVEIRKVLRRMDFRPPAVYIDMVLAEVDLTNSMRYGVEWFLKSTGNWLLSADTRLGFDVATTGGMAVGIISPSNNFATLQLLGSETTFSLLSSPKLVVRNGATANIRVGSEQPVIKTKSTASGAGINTIIEPEYKKVGLDLEVTPFVSSSNEVRLLIKVKDTAITGQVLLAGDRYPIYANRELNTDLVTSDGHTIFLGGIRRQDANDTSAKIPGPGDLPVVGAAFRNKQMDSSGSELIILATATVIIDQQGADIVTGALIRAGSKSMGDLRPPTSGFFSKRETAASPAAVTPAAATPAVAAPAAATPAAVTPAVVTTPAAVTPAVAAPVESPPVGAAAVATPPAATSSAAAAPPPAASAAGVPAAAAAETAAPKPAAPPAKAGKKTKTKASKNAPPATGAPKSSASQ